MVLTEKHIVYEDKCRNMFVGETIQGVIYGGLKFDFEDSEIPDEEPDYFTKYPDIDTLDHSIYFKTSNINNRTIYVFWDSNFFSYGLLSKEINLDNTTNNYEQKWDVSNTEKWVNIIGKKIIDFKINWEEVVTSDVDGSNSKHYIYPQTFILKLEDEKIIILSTSEFKDQEQNEVYKMSDNLLVTTNLELAKELKIV